jgi:hypothetical protein
MTTGTGKLFLILNPVPLIPPVSSFVHLLPWTANGGLSTIQSKHAAYALQKSHHLRSMSIIGCNQTLTAGRSSQIVIPNRSVLCQWLNLSVFNNPRSLSKSQKMSTG